MLVEQLDLVLRITLAGVVAALIGLERELRGHAPGIRTHALVAVGAALFTVAGAYGFQDVTGGDNTDPARIAAQVAAGIGFIGAGAVLRSGLSVRGLTTAATLWVSAAIGVSAGAATYGPLVGAVLVSIVILIGLRVVKPKLLKRFGSRHRVLDIEYERGYGTLGPVMRGLRTLNCQIAELALEDDDEDDLAGRRRARISFTAPDDGALTSLLQSLHQRPEVVAARVEAGSAVAITAPDSTERANPTAATYDSEPARPLAEQGVEDDGTEDASLGAGPELVAAVQEVELQYVYDGESTESVPVTLAGLALRRSKQLDIIDTYYDTEDLALRRAGCSLRIRQRAGRRPQLVWKGPATRRADGAKSRQECTVALKRRARPEGDLEEALLASGLVAAVTDTAGVEGPEELRAIGQLRNQRSVHIYGEGALELELVWDRLHYPRGPGEVRVEVEAKTRPAADLLGVVGAELEARFGGDLRPATRGKARELCSRLYPQLSAA